MRIQRMDGDPRLRERPIGELLHELADEARGLLRDEVRLARAEVRDEARKAARGGAAIGAGGAVLYAALFFLGATLVLLGARFMPAWVAALGVTALYAIAGLVAVQSGKRKLAATEPRRAIQSIQEDGRWARETIRDVKSSRSASA